MKSAARTLAYAYALAAAVAAHAELTDLGFGLIYDSTLDITWLADANRAATSGYDIDGKMSWEAAQAWVATLTAGQVSGWRLPRMTSTSASEYSHLFTDYGIRSNNTASAPFFNFPARPGYYDTISYWTATEQANNPLNAWYYTFEGPGLYTNLHGTTNKNSESAYAMAVHDGNVSLLPKEEFWAGYKVLPGGLVDTGTWLRWLYIVNAPWVWSYSLSKWIYVMESEVNPGSPWIYITRDFFEPVPELVTLSDTLVYDTKLDVTWLADANLAATSGHDADGRMNWTEAQAWAQGLVIDGVGGWRLPRMLAGGGSELSHLFTDYNISCTPYNSTADLSGPFDNIPPHTGYYDTISYWTSTDKADDPLSAWSYTFEGPGSYANLHGTAGKEAGSAYAWAVHDGNVAHLASGDVWAGYTVADGYVDTGSWMGWVYVDVSNSPWIWSFQLGKWLYVAEEQVTRYGAWIYSAR